MDFSGDTLLFFPGASRNTRACIDARDFFNYCIKTFRTKGAVGAYSLIQFTCFIRSC